LGGVTTSVPRERTRLTIKVPLSLQAAIGQQGKALVSLINSSAILQSAVVSAVLNETYEARKERFLF
jgi:hypothetical protein